jgi:hypothetical protein
VLPAVPGAHRLCMPPEVGICANYGPRNRQIAKLSARHAIGTTDSVPQTLGGICDPMRSDNVWQFHPGIFRAW